MLGSSTYYKGTKERVKKMSRSERRDETNAVTRTVPFITDSSSDMNKLFA
jgi:hypothetical protein